MHMLRVDDTVTLGTGELRIENNGQCEQETESNNDVPIKIGTRTLKKNSGIPSYVISMCGNIRPLQD